VFQELIRGTGRKHKSKFDANHHVEKEIILRV
jgi:hypothetical protein